jgi:heme exporter protein A
MLNADALAVWRGDRCLFSGLDLAVNGGELLYVSGPNGSGKTTLLRMLCGLVYAEEGVIRWAGEDIRELGDDYHRELFYFGHLNGIKGELTALENLKMAAMLAGWVLDEGPILDALTRMGLEGYEDLPTKVLSQGQKRRVALAGLLLTRARLWILDEPFTALDVAAIATLRDTLRAHLEAQGLVVLTTHQEVAFDAVPVRHLRMGQAPGRDA